MQSCMGAEGTVRIGDQYATRVSTKWRERTEVLSFSINM
jgi:hypothetical protein